MPKQHPTNEKNILAAARQLKRMHGLRGNPLKKMKAQKEFTKLRKKAIREAGGKSYDTDYHFYIRSIATGVFKQSIAKQEHAIECAKQNLVKCSGHVAHWLKVAAIYQRKVELLEDVLNQRQRNLAAYKRKCDMIAEKYKNCGVRKLK